MYATKLLVGADNGDYYPAAVDITPVCLTATSWDQYLRRLVTAVSQVCAARVSYFSPKVFVDKENEAWMQVYGGLYDLLELARSPFIPSPQIMAVGLCPDLLSTLKEPDRSEVTLIMNSLKKQLRRRQARSMIPSS